MLQIRVSNCESDMCLVLTMVYTKMQICQWMPSVPRENDQQQDLDRPKDYSVRWKPRSVTPNICKADRIPKHGPISVMNISMVTARRRSKFKPLSPKMSIPRSRRLQDSPLGQRMALRILISMLSRPV